MTCHRFTFAVVAVPMMSGLLMAALTPPSIAAPSRNAEHNHYLLKNEPKDAQSVLAVRKHAKDQQDIVVVGRIGGRSNPWVKNVAAFTIVDLSLKSCNEDSGDRCAKGWEFCCSANLAQATLFVTVVDDAGRLVRQDARELLGVNELDTIVIQGKAKRDEAGNVTILASKIHVRPDKSEVTR